METLNPYDLVAQELRDGIHFDAVWLEAWAKSGGVESRASAIYIELRAQEIRQAIADGLARDRMAAKQERPQIKEAQKQEKALRRRERNETIRHIGLAVSVILAIIFICGFITTCVHQ